MNCSLLRNLAHNLLNDSIQFPDRNFNYHFYEGLDSSHAEIVALATLFMYATNTTDISTSDSNSTSKRLDILDATSPAFFANEKNTIVYPMWAESAQIMNKHERYGARLYVVPSQGSGLTYLLFGLVVLVLSVCGSFGVKKIAQERSNLCEEVPNASET
ncbi:hypothetical protein ACOME3_003911 [Neoechinorhynchus agilis]